LKDKQELQQSQVVLCSWGVFTKTERVSQMSRMFIISPEGKVLSADKFHQPFFWNVILPNIPEKLNMAAIKRYQKINPTDRSWKNLWARYESDPISFPEIFEHFWTRLSFDQFYSFTAYIGYICGRREEHELILRINDYDDIRDSQIESVLELLKGCRLVLVDLIHNAQNTETKYLRPSEFIDEL
jgi:hypothetical protein